MKHLAFSRSEFLIAIAVAGGVAIFKIVPWMADQRKIAILQRETQCQDNLKMIGMSLMQYEQDYDGHFPLSHARAATGWSDALAPYGIRDTMISRNGTRTTILDCPEGSASTKASTDYFFNSRLSGVAQSRISTPSQVIAFGDGTDNAPPNATLSSLPSQWIKNASSPAARHVLNNRAYANYGFADGHVKSIEPTRIGSTTTGDTRYQTFAIH